MTDNAPILRSQQDDQSLKIPGWVTILQDWKSVVWPAFAAILAGFFYFLGFVVNNGRLTALGISKVIEKPTINQEYFFRGVATLVGLGIYAAFIIAFLVVMRAIFMRLFRLLPTKLRTWLRTITNSRTWGWLIVAVAIAIWVCEGIAWNVLAKDIDSLILKSTKELGGWLSLGLDADQTSIYGYSFLVVVVLVLFVIFSWWILTKFAKTTVGRLAYGAWAIICVFMLLSEFAFLFGVSSSFDPYPLVAFSGLQEKFEKDTVAALLGSDDKQYAFLIVLNVGPGNETPKPGKIIMYVPRSEVKWMIVFRQMPLNLVSHYHDFKELLQSVPKPNASGPENPKQ